MQAVGLRDKTDWAHNYFHLGKEPHFLSPGTQVLNCCLSKGRCVVDFMQSGLRGGAPPKGQESHRNRSHSPNDSCLLSDGFHVDHRPDAS